MIPHSAVAAFLRSKKHLITADWISEARAAFQGPKNKKVDKLIALGSRLEVAKHPLVVNPGRLVEFMSALLYFAERMQEIERLGLKPGVVVCIHPNVRPERGKIKSITESFYLLLEGRPGLFTPLGVKVIRRRPA